MRGLDITSREKEEEEKGGAFQGGGVEQPAELELKIKIIHSDYS